MYYENTTYIKLGKSNTPYLRCLSFADKSVVTPKFIGQVKFKNEDDAYSFEKYLKHKYKVHNVNHNFARLFMYNGFTEVYNSVILPSLLRDLELKENEYDS